MLGLVILLPFLTYYSVQAGYCQGWWGKQNLFFRSLWLCSCSPELEHTFYPDHVEVMFSACQEVIIQPSWDGYFLVTGDKNYEDSNRYLLNGFTGEKINLDLVDSPDRITLLPEHMIFYSSQIHNWKEEWIVSIDQSRESLPAPFSDKNIVNPEMVELLQTKEYIILVHYGYPYILAFDKAINEPGISLSWGHFSELGSRWPVEFLEASELSYISIPPPEFRRLPPYNMISPNGRFLAENDGIYDVATGQQVATIPFVDKDPFSTPFSNNYRPCCWFPYSSTVIYQFEPPVGGSFYEVTLIEWLDRIAFGAPIHMDTFSLPVLKVHVPEEYQ